MSILESLPIQLEYGPYSSFGTKLWVVLFMYGQLAIAIVLIGLLFHLGWDLI